MHIYGDIDIRISHHGHKRSQWQDIFVWIHECVQLLSKPHSPIEDGRCGSPTVSPLLILVLASALTKASSPGNEGVVYGILDTSSSNSIQV